MAPFIRRVRTASGATAVQIVEKQGRKNVVLKHVGSAHNEVELTVLMQAAHDELHPGQTTLDLEPKRRHARSALRVGGKRSALLWSVLDKAYVDIGFDVLGDEAFKQMVLARLIEPCSKEATVNVLERLGIEHVSRRTLFNSLKRCAQRSYRDTLAQACFSHASRHGDLSELSWASVLGGDS